MSLVAIGSLLSLLTSLGLVTSSASFKHAAITPRTFSNGVGILHNRDSVVVSPNEWKVTFTTQQSYDLVLQLNHEWCFDAVNPSMITLTINGTNYNTAEGDLLLIVSVANIQYFGIVIRNEASSQLYKAFPQPTIAELYEANVLSMVAPSTPDRWHRITQNTDWFNTDPIYRNPVGQSTEWPLVISIYNDPIHDIVRYSHSGYHSNEELYSVLYLSSFAPGRGMDVYLATDGEGESFGVYNIDIQYEVQIVPTYNPSASPTAEPSVSPTTDTIAPTMTPTLSPTTRTSTPTHTPPISAEPPVSISTTALYTKQPDTTTATTRKPTEQPPSTSTHGMHPSLPSEHTLPPAAVNKTVSLNPLLPESYGAVEQSSEASTKGLKVLATVTGGIGLAFCGVAVLLMIFCAQSHKYEQHERNLSKMNRKLSDGMIKHQISMQTAASNFSKQPSALGILNDYDHVYDQDIDHEVLVPRQITEFDEDEAQLIDPHLHVVVNDHEQRLQEAARANHTELVTEEKKIEVNAEEEKERESKEGDLITTALNCINHLAMPSNASSINTVQTVNTLNTADEMNRSAMSQHSKHALADSLRSAESLPTRHSLQSGDVGSMESGRSFTAATTTHDHPQHLGHKESINTIYTQQSFEIDGVEQHYGHVPRVNTNDTMIMFGSCQEQEQNGNENVFKVDYGKMADYINDDEVFSYQ